MLDGCEGEQSIWAPSAHKFDYYFRPVSGLTSVGATGRSPYEVSAFPCITQWRLQTFYLFTVAGAAWALFAVLSELTNFPFQF